MVRDLKLLTAATKGINDRNLSESLTIFRHDEIGELARSFEKMHIDLQVDEMTGVYNRETFMRLLYRLIREIHDASIKIVSPEKLAMRSFSILFVDKNKFKGINDAFGHLAGDKMLRAVARGLCPAVRAVDIVARWRR